MEIGVFIPIGSNGWLISTTSPQYKPSFELNKQITLNAERYGLDFVLSMIKLRGFGGKSEFWDHNLESFTLMAGLAAVTSRIKLYRHVPTLVIPPAIAARMATTIDSISNGRFGLNLITGWQRPEYSPDGPVAGRRVFRATATTTLAEYVADPARAVGDRRLRLQGRVLHRWTTAGSSPRPQADMKIICAGQSDAGMAFIGQVCRLQFLLRQGRQHADRLRADRRAPADGHRQDRPHGRVLRPVHDHHRRDRRRGRGQVGALQGRRRPRGDGLAGRSRARPTPSRAPTPTCASIADPKSSGEHQHGPAGAARYATVARMLDEIGDHPGPGGRAADLRRLRERHRGLRRRASSR